MKTDVIDFIGNYRKYYNYDYNELDFEFNNPDVVNKALIAFSKRKQTVYTLYALEVLIEKLPGICFTGELVRILCENDIGVVALAHKDLDDCCLIIVAGYCKSWLPEPFTRLIDRKSVV